MCLENFLKNYISPVQINFLFSNKYFWIKNKNEMYIIYFRPSGAGNRCCYDKNGNLMYTNDTNSGSTPGIVEL